MKRRGPTYGTAGEDKFGTVMQTESTMSQLGSEHDDIFNFDATPGLADRVAASSGAVARQIPPWPFQLSRNESQVLDHYIQRFSRTYPTFSGPNNPFLRIFLPLSMQSRVVLDSLLALSAVQSWDNGSFAMGDAMLGFRQKALRGCMTLLGNINSAPRQLLLRSAGEMTSAAESSSGDVDGEQLATDDVLYLLSSCVLLLLYEKLAGEGQDNRTPHIQFFTRMFPGRLLTGTVNGTPVTEIDPTRTEAFQFLSNLFLYNDLVRSTTLQTATLSPFYLGKTAEAATISPIDQNTLRLLPLQDERFKFPRIIARLSMGDLSVTDADIAAWNGRLDWLPSYALNAAPDRGHMQEQLPTGDPTALADPLFERLDSFTGVTGWDDNALISELYRVAAAIYRRQCVARFLKDTGQLMTSDGCGLDDLATGNLGLWAVQLIQLLPTGSSFENTLLWPIGISAKELSSERVFERDAVFQRLQSLERRFQMRHFAAIREFLTKFWQARDAGLDYRDNEPILFG